MSTEELSHKLKKILDEKHSNTIQEAKTSLEHVSIAVLPPTKSKPKSLALIVRTPGKWKGTFIRSKTELEDLKKIISDPKVEQLIDVIEKINPKTKKPEEMKVEF